MENKYEFQRVYDQFYRKIVHFLINFTGKNDAEDLAQEVFIKVNNSLSTFKEESTISTWLYRIAANTAVDRARNQSFKNIIPMNLEEFFIDDIDCADAWIRDKAPSLEAEIVKKEMNACIRGFIDKLPEDYKAVFILSEFEGVKNQEIAAKLGVSLDTVKIRMHRARIKLKKELRKNCNLYRNDENELACDSKTALFK